MKPFLANFINGLVLLGMGIWAVADSDGSSNTVYITPLVGFALLMLTPGLKKENKVVAHVVVLITFLFILALIFPLMRAEGTALYRILIQMMTSAFAMIVFIGSFIQARRNKA